MKIVLAAIAGLLALVAIVTLIGFALPRNHRAVSRITLQQSPPGVWLVVRDLGALQGIWKDLESTTRLPDQEGKERWEQKASGYSMTLIVEQATAPSRLVTRIDAAPDAAFGGTWTYDLAPEGTGTRVTVTEDGYVSNPIFRVMMKAMGVHRTADAYLTALGTKFGETVKPEHVE